MNWTMASIQQSAEQSAEQPAVG
ncbi:hypothetical protein CSPAE12_02066 [Colletotrichum incanum]|nr:hypothetical protein CSPAE12_02066 [Colletotrichum incanum]